MRIVSPQLDVVRVERVWSAGGVVQIAARTRELPVGCPDCAGVSARVHSRYVRTLADLAVGGRPVLIRLSVRRLFCDNSRCGRRTFAEQVDELTVRYQRRTPLLQHLVEMAAVLLAGRGGARLLQIVNAPLSRTSVLFHLMRMPLPPAATPRVLGVDDFALYADVYGTLLVDADTRLPLTLWAGRDSAQLAAWLREHPGVEIVCRDGSLQYRQGINDGAPDATQVSDRFHLWQGLSKRVADIAAAHRGCLPAAAPEPEPPAPALPASDVLDTPARRHAKQLFEAVHAVTDSGRSLNAAARELHLDWRTVRKYARAATWQDCVRRPRPHQPTALDPYLDYLQQRWAEGEHTAKVLHQELLAKGYRGHYQRVKTAVAPLRRGLPIDTPRERPPSPRTVARWITTAPPRRGLHTIERLDRLLAHCPELNTAHTLVRDFAAMLDTQDAAPLSNWLDGLTTSRLAPMASLAKAIREDLPAVEQGITTPFNSGVNEGRITDLKLQKRIMAGRAGVPLLRHRIVLMAHLRRRFP
ncbi:transposase [Streptomyces davaonensis JCM 4913]|uniref:Transposase n=1 Tax=Streptomyces davaonensis (strain DSM 101723 / JCM 4913 / KCC S-0913 / 768) TaxID=1214101 RepID=K4REQ8_STRDJ|nr:ISL3 family transposase [Streptomyces davaonensis]CCK32082.1 transposase [Streptomyces davaonensis JCM 4913]